MTNLNYKKMSREELRKYVLLHRDDDEAIRVFVNRRNPNAKIYPANQTSDEIKQIILEKIERKEQEDSA